MSTAPDKRTRDELEEALRTLPASEVEPRIDALNEFAGIEHTVDKYERSLDLATEALSLAVRRGDRGREAAARMRIAAAHASLSRPDAAAAQYERALDLAREVGNLRMEGTVMSSLGGVRARQGRTAEALVLVEEALALHRKGGELAYVAHAQRERGHVRRDQGDMEGALADYVEAAAVYRDLGDLPATASVLSSIGTIHRRRGRYLDALAAFREAAGFYERVGLRRGLATVIGNAANVLMARGDHAAAIAEHERALEIHRSIGDLAGVALCLGNIGSALRTLDRKACFPVLVQAIEAAVASGNVPTRAHALANLAEAFIGEGRFAEARRFADEALVLFRGMEDRRQIANTISVLGRAARLAGDDPVPVFVESLARARESQSPDTLQPALAWTSDAFRRAGRLDEARALAAELATWPGANNLASARCLLARTLSPAEAEAPAREALDAAGLAGVPVLISVAAGILARSLAATGRAAEARALLEEAFAALSPQATVMERLDLLGDAAFALRACGDEEGARGREAEARGITGRGSLGEADGG